MGQEVGRRDPAGVRPFDAFTFDFRRTEHGWFQAHIYEFDENTSTFIVECPEHMWLAHGLDRADQQQSIALCERLFAENLRLRDHVWLEGYERWFAERAGVSVPARHEPPPPMFTPYAVRTWPTWPGR